MSSSQARIAVGDGPRPRSFMVSWLWSRATSTSHGFYRRTWRSCGGNAELSCPRNPRFFRLGRSMGGADREPVRAASSRLQQNKRCGVLDLARTKSFQPAPRPSQTYKGVELWRKRDELGSPPGFKLPNRSHADSTATDQKKKAEKASPKTRKLVAGRADRNPGRGGTRRRVRWARIDFVLGRIGPITRIIHVLPYPTSMQRGPRKRAESGTYSRYGSVKRAPGGGGGPARPCGWMRVARRTWTHLHNPLPLHFNGAWSPAAAWLLLSLWTREGLGLAKKLPVRGTARQVIGEARLSVYLPGEPLPTLVAARDVYLVCKRLIPRPWSSRSVSMRASRP